MTLAYRMAERGYHNPLLIMVSPSDCGKTDTLDMFSRDFDGIFLIPSSTETKQISLLKQRPGTITWVLDEPDDWNEKDLKRILMVLKHIATGKLKPARATSYGHDVSRSICSAVIICCNDEQLKSNYYAFQKTGLLARALVIMSDQDAITKNYVHDYYKSHKCKSGLKLPVFKKNMLIHELEDEMILIPDAKKWINRYFSGFVKDTVEWICMMTTEQQFNEFKPFLKSHYDYDLINERIEFE